MGKESDNEIKMAIGSEGDSSQENTIKDILEAHQLNRRKFIKGSAAAVAALSIGPFFMRESFASGPAASEWTIGTIYPLTGPMAFGGNEGMAGSQIAVDMINAQGGANTQSGKKKIVFAKANAPDQTAATSEMNRLIANEGVHVVTGSFSSAIAFTASAIAERNKVIFWENAAVITDLTRRGFQYLFRVDASAMFTGGGASRFVADYIAPILKMEPKDIRIGVVWEDGSYGVTVRDGMMAGAKERGLQVVVDEGYSVKATDLSSVVLKLKAAKPDAILAASIGADAIVLSKALRDLNVNPKALLGASGGFAVPGYSQNVGKASNGVFSSDLPTEVNPKALTEKSLALRAEMLKRYHEMKGGQAPSTNVWNSFCGTMLLLDDVLSKVKTLDPDEVREAALSVDLPVGSLSNGMGAKFTPHNQPDGGQNERAFTVVLQWWDSKLHVVYPDKFALRKAEYIPLPTWAEREKV